MCEKVNVALCFQWSVRLEKQFVNAGPCLSISSSSTTTNIKLLPICRYLVFRFRWSVILTLTRHYFPNFIEQSSDMTSPLSTQLSCFSFCCYQDWIAADSSVFSTLCPSVQKQKVWLSDCCDSAFYTNSQQCSFWSSKSNYLSSTFLGEVAFKSLICCLCMLSMIGSDT